MLRTDFCGFLPVFYPCPSSSSTSNPRAMETRDVTDGWKQRQVHRLPLTARQRLFPPWNSRNGRGIHDFHLDPLILFSPYALP